MAGSIQGNSEELYDISVKFPVDFEEKQEVSFDYEPPPEGKRTGRYIGHR